MSGATNAPPGAADTLVLTVGTTNLTGWQRVSVTRSLDQPPATFDIQVTEKYPNTADVDVKPGQPCVVRIGSDLVITGYVDRYTSSVSAGQHTVRIQGRSKSEDLIDCSAIMDTTSPTPHGQLVGGTALSIARALAEPYGVTINSNAGDGATVPFFNINLGETPWEIIDRVVRYSQLIAYDLPDGSYLLAQAGSEKMGSGFTVGQNCEAADITYAMDQRFSEYEGHFLTSMVMGTDMGINAPLVGKVVKDEGVPRLRKRYVISEQTGLSLDLPYQRALWECNRRKGRSQMLSVTCDSWRDINGKLWDLNHLAPIKAPQLKLGSATWLIGSVNYVRDESGQHAQLVLMPPEAYQPEPVALMPLPRQLTDIHAVNNPTGASGPSDTSRLNQ